MRVVVTTHKGMPFCFEILGHAPDEKVCAAFSTVKEILEIGTREFYKRDCFLNETDGQFMLQIKKEPHDDMFFVIIKAMLKRLCEDNSIDFTEEQDDD